MKENKTRNLEKFRKYALNRDQLKKVKGGEWVIIDGVLVWVT